MTKSKYSRKKEFYVYALLDPRKPGPFYYGRWKFSHEPFYVGKGKGDRAWSHIQDSGRSNKYNMFKARKTNKILSEGAAPLVILKAQSLTEKQALVLEVRLIDLIGRHNTGCGPLTNLSDGGEGVSGKVLTKKGRLAMSQARKAYMSTLSTQEYADMEVKRLAGLAKAREAGKCTPPPRDTWSKDRLKKAIAGGRKGAVAKWTGKNAESHRREAASRLTNYNISLTQEEKNLRTSKAWESRRAVLGKCPHKNRVVAFNVTVAAPLMDYIQNRTPKQIAGWKKKVAATMAAKTPQERSASAKRRAAGQKARWSKATAKDRAAHGLAVSKATKGKPRSHTTC